MIYCVHQDAFEGLLASSVVAVMVPWRALEDSSRHRLVVGVLSCFVVVAHGELCDEGEEQLMVFHAGA